MTPTSRDAGRETAPHLDATEARQATAPHRLRYMLGFGLAAVVAAFAVIYVAYVLG